MRVLAAFAVAAAVLAALPAAAAAEAWEPDVRGAAAWAAGRQGSVSFVVRTPARPFGLRVWRTAPTASVLKAMLLVAYLRRGPVRWRPLRPADRRLLAPMVRRSDDVAATRVRDVVGNAALRRLARRAGMRRFRTHPVWGLSRFCAADGARLMLRIDRLTPQRHRRYALRLLGTVVRAQRWGIARVRPRGWALFFKGGWGSGTGAVDHQVALLRRGRRRLAVAILTTGSPSHAYAKETLRGVAARLLRRLRPDSALADPASG